jgi:hypothetical protein
MRTADCDRIVVVIARIRLQRIDQGCLHATGERRQIGEQHTPDRELSWLTVAMTAAATRSQFVGRKSERYTDAEKIIVQWKYPQFMRKWKLFRKHIQLLGFHPLSPRFQVIEVRRTRDLIRSHGILHRLWYGDVAQVIDKAPCAVLVVPVD